MVSVNNCLKNKNYDLSVINVIMYFYNANKYDNKIPRNKTSVISLVFPNLSFLHRSSLGFFLCTVNDILNLWLLPCTRFACDFCHRDIFFFNINNIYVKNNLI